MVPARSRRSLRSLVSHESPICSERQCNEYPRHKCSGHECLQQCHRQSPKQRHLCEPAWRARNYGRKSRYVCECASGEPQYRARGHATLCLGAGHARSRAQHSAVASERNWSGTPGTASASSAGHQPACSRDPSATSDESACRSGNDQDGCSSVGTNRACCARRSS